MTYERDDIGKTLVAVGVLFGLGTVYNALVEHWGRSGYLEGYTGILVVAGTAVVLLFALPLIGARSFLQLLALFAAAGAPMTAGSMQRYASRRRQAEEYRHGHLS